MFLYFRLPCHAFNDLLCPPAGKDNPYGLEEDLYIAPQAPVINVLNDTLCQWENIYGTVSSEVNPELRFKGIIRRAYEQTGQRVVILVEEYDKPMLQAIGDEELQNEYRNTLKAFYSVMKTQDRYIRFGFLTGVTKFGKVSVFNDLNNLIDLSMDRQFQTLCGMTDKEIHTYFEEPLHRIAENYDITYDEACRRLKERYDGYRFRQNGTNLYLSLIHISEPTRH